METIKSLHKDYEIVRHESELSFIATRKGKMFFFRKFDVYSEEWKSIPFLAKKLSNSGVKTPKFIGKDKKNGYLIREYIDGDLLTDIMSKKDLADEVYEQLFKNAYMAKIHKMTLDYLPHNWMMKDGILYYIAPYYYPYNAKEDLANKYLPLYFNTQELKRYMDENGIFYDKSRIKNAFETNKQMALTTCKYYR